MDLLTKLQKNPFAPITTDEVTQEETQWGPWRTRVELRPELTVGPASPRTILRSQHLYDTIRATFGSVYQCDFLDLGALNGSIYYPFAAAGAYITAVDARESNCRKLEILNLCQHFIASVHQQDVRSYPIPRGQYDIINFSGLFYHLEAADALKVLIRIAAAKPRVLILDSWFSDRPNSLYSFTHAGKSYDFRGQTWPERFGNQLHVPDASVGNTEAYRFKVEDIVGFLYDLGFAAVLNHLFVWERIPGVAKHKSGADYKFRKLLLAYGT